MKSLTGIDLSAESILEFLEYLEEATNEVVEIHQVSRAIRILAPDEYKAAQFRMKKRLQAGR